MSKTQKKFKNLKDLMLFLSEYLPEKVALVKDQPRYGEVEKAIAEISSVIWKADKKASIIIEPDEITGSAMTITVMFEMLVIEDVKTLCQSLEKANNVEIYPYADGKIGIGIMFYGCYKTAPSCDEPFPEYATSEEAED